MPRAVFLFTVLFVAAGAAFLLLRSRSEDASNGAVASLPPSPANESASAARGPSRPAGKRFTPATRRPGATATADNDPAAEAAAAAPVTRTATLTVTSDIPGAQVFLDRRFIGATPMTASDIQPGTHQLNVSAPGFDPYVETIAVDPGQRTIAVTFREVRLDLAIDVVHKHRVGSCRGRLVATAHGLRYDTEDTDDVFRAPLLELETFEIDYLDKTLQIQPRSGKNYTFTDPAGNADHLFVFHRDVERTRQRLKKGDRPAG
jgi:hypothetical protein